MKHLFSIDLEDWYHYIGDPSSPCYEDWDNCESRVCEMTDFLLHKLRDYKVTFFVLGYIAKRHPELLRKIVNQGHEIACHGNKHEFVFQLGPKKFEEDLRISKSLIEDTTGKECKGYRAPGFSIRNQDLHWAMEIIKEAGFLYDSSIFPGIRTSGGVMGAFPHPHVYISKSGPLIEIPVSTRRVFGRNIVFAGGGFFRFCPERILISSIHQICKKGHPGVTYVHPQDFDIHQPRMKLKWFNRFMYYYGLKSSKGKLQRLLNDFEWITFEKFIEDKGSNLPVYEYGTNNG